MAPNIGVVRFPGTNCEFDTVEAVNALGAQGEILWHGDTSLGNSDAVIIAGGFAHGDYLRPGAIARFSPIMESIIAAANDGMPVIGICNGFCNREQNSGSCVGIGIVWRGGRTQGWTAYNIGCFEHTTNRDQCANSFGPIAA